LSSQDLFIIFGNKTISFVRICIDGELLHVGYSVGMLATHIALACAIHKCLAGHGEGDGSQTLLSLLIYDAIRLANLDVDIGLLHVGAAVHS
jgi:hypothetical protein